METKVFISLGTNIGSLETNLQRARELICQVEGVRLAGSSRVALTRPVGRTDQPDFLNQVLRLSCRITPQELLSRLLAIESDMGRVRAERWGPRLIDLDILFYGRLELAGPDLTIPHPELANRPFFLELVDEIDPEFLAGWPQFRQFRDKQE